MKIDLAVSAEGPDQRQAAARAERGGYDGLWTSEVRHDPYLALGLAATATERITLGTCIAVAFARNPMTTAVVADDLQALSGGRLVLGLGSQIKAHITRRFSMPWSHPAARMREYVLALRAIWGARQSGERLDFQGDFYQHTLLTPMFTPAPHGHPAPPVLLAGVGTAMTKVAGEVADGFLCHAFTTERYLREVTLPALTAARGGSLDGFEMVGAPFLVTGSTEEELTASATAVRRQIAFYASTPAYRGVLELHGWGALQDELRPLSKAGAWERMGELITDEILDAFAIVGEPTQAGGELTRRYGDVLTRASLLTLTATVASTTAEIADAARKEATA
ncbi:TIGR03617 family F420-dependent LLM class oxidoreductase [Streptomyces sp. NPDC058247]|uniref:TIGR03617 family F420-dependent LLM class oxidoreductase n=1 Tax=Streptomyces sp. NPDC058247 TaxID=3346401 RepID=UPI0036E95AAE